MIVDNKNQTVVVRKAREVVAKNRHGEELRLREEIEVVFQALTKAFVEGPKNLRAVNAYKEKYDELEGQLIRLIC